MAKPQYGSVWRKMRLHVLERDGYRCRINLPGCVGDANTVDHITPVEHGGTMDPLNLRAACWRCNSKRGNITKGSSGHAHPGHTLPPSREW